MRVILPPMGEFLSQIFIRDVRKATQIFLDISKIHIKKKWEKRNYQQTCIFKRVQDTGKSDYKYTKRLHFCPWDEVAGDRWFPSKVTNDFLKLCKRMSLPSLPAAVWSGWTLGKFRLLPESLLDPPRASLVSSFPHVKCVDITDYIRLSGAWKRYL